MDVQIKAIIQKAKVVPVIKLEKAKDALPLMDALQSGGLPIAEITFRTSAAAQAISLVRKHRPEIFLGAGTVLTLEQAQEAVDAGAAFIVSPGFNPELVHWCIKGNIPIVPGVNSPTQVEMGLRKGLKVLKFFPAEASGGIAMLKALGSVYEVEFMPTGGISQKNILSYLALPSVIACGGTWMVKADLISSGNYEEITKITREAVELVKNA
ncbi:MAG: bifunctional 4-hydroxy-2-oxoglutarate aldolase/2-dehydro-3-deoxy-phosphogluconate aldolase [Spirochaetales bacterium]|jgi:2-dehydro-3-deoxyphosphogluconate aldolase/(4S)-4-hydroxy-2-oxoglutarate aldolase|nr:bifunctional 4-hydroxy-2-oxoglutarate aldolase/2-dehydro-3-deoxy-phosphogluconate aldolase [Spirochaetales bacterium]